MLSEFKSGLDTVNQTIKWKLKVTLGYHTHWFTLCIILGFPNFITKEHIAVKVHV